MSLPKVLILTTGGTIASQSGAPIVSGKDLISAIPELGKYADIEVREVLRIGSSKMTPEHWMILHKTIHDVATSNSKPTCILVTHGTDSMEETAYFLHLTHRHAIPVILVGSMRSSNEISADGPANLINAVRVGLSRDAIGKGVLVVLNEDISSARDATKTHNRRTNAFAPGQKGFLGVADPDQIEFYREPVRLHTTNSEFDITEIEFLPRVDILKDFTGMDSDILDFYMERSNEGLVIESFAGGRTSQAVFDLLSNGPLSKPIAVASSVIEGRITSAPTLESPIYAIDLSARKARILLMLALTQTVDLSEIKRIFESY